MVSSRNAPCPCGSGRKYKHCCWSLDVGAVDVDAAMSHARAAAASARVWEVEAVPLLIGFEEGVAHRPAAVLVVAQGMVVYHDLRAQLSGAIETIASVLEKAVTTTARDCGSYPEEVWLRHEEVAEPLRRKLAPRQVSVVVRDPLVELETAARALMEELSEGSMWPPPCRPETWAGWGLPGPLVAEVFAAAASFWTAAPWCTASNLQAPRVILPSGNEWTACILGNGGEEFGLALYSNADDLFEGAAHADPEDGFAYVQGRMVSVGFERIAELFPRARREVMERRWKLASTEAYPALLTVNTPGGGVTTTQVKDLIALLRAVPEFVEKHQGILDRENERGTPAPPIEWRHAETGILFRYSGEALATTTSPDAFELEFLTLMEETLAGAAEDAGIDSEELLNALQSRLRGSSDTYNNAPQQDLGDLSPSQVRQLLESDWGGPNAAVALRRDLPAAALDGADLLFNVRTLLGLAIEEGGSLGATQAGNLKVAVVGEILPRVRLGSAAAHIDDTRRPLREGEISRIYHARVVAELAELIRQRGSRFEVTQRGEELCDEERAGELYALLFDTWFRRFNLGYASFAEWLELQAQIAFTLYRLSTLGDAEHRSSDLVAATVLPFAKERAPRNPHHDLPSLLFEQQCLTSLEMFGLVTSTRMPRKPPSTASDWRYRVTPLFAEFLSFPLIPVSAD